MNSFDLSIIIVSYNSWKYLNRCLASIDKYPPGATFEIILVDNCSSDGSPEKVAKHYPHVKLIRNKNNSGFAAANNKGILLSNGDFVLFLNSDTELLPNSLDPLIQYLIENPCAGIVGPTEQSARGLPYPSISPFPDLSYLFLTHTSLRHRFYRYKWFHPYRRLWERAQASKKPILVDWVSGASLMIRRKLLDEVGAFDEGYFFYMEETDLCTCAQFAGWETYFIPTAKITHHGSISTRHVKNGLLSLSGALGELYYFKKHRKHFELMLLRELLLLEYALKYFLIKSHDPRRWAFKEILRAVLGFRPWKITENDRNRNRLN